MDDANLQSRLANLNWDELFPYHRIFRSFKMAVKLEKILLSTLGVAGVWLLGVVLDKLWWWTAGVEPFSATLAQVSDLLLEQVLLNAIALDIGAALAGIAAVLLAAATLFTTFPIFSILLYIGTLIVFALTLGAVARIAAVEAARDDPITAWEGFNYARGHLISLIAAPLIPMLILGAVALAVWVAALVANLLSTGWTGWIGYVLAGLLLIVALVAGLIASLVIVSAVLGLPFMYPTIATDNTDHFDAVSRSVNYIYGRPFMVAFSGLLAIVFGAFCFAFVYFIVYLTLSFTHAVTTAGFPGADGMAGIWPQPRIDRLYSPPPSITDSPFMPLADPTPATATPANGVIEAAAAARPAAPASLSRTEQAILNVQQHRAELQRVNDERARQGLSEQDVPPLYWEELGFMTTGGAALVWVWVHVFIALLAGYLLSYVICASTQIYYLVRREVDGIEFDDVFIEEYDDEEVVPTNEPSTPAAAPLATGVQLGISPAMTAATAAAAKAGEPMQAKPGEAPKPEPASPATPGGPSSTVNATASTPAETGVGGDDDRAMETAQPAEPGSAAVPANAPAGGPPEVTTGAPNEQPVKPSEPAPQEPPTSQSGGVG